MLTPVLIVFTAVCRPFTRLFSIAIAAVVMKIEHAIRFVV